jgi:hypothetical protein
VVVSTASVASYSVVVGRINAHCDKTTIENSICTVKRVLNRPIPSVSIECCSLYRRKAADESMDSISKFVNKSCEPKPSGKLRTERKDHLQIVVRSQGPGDYVTKDRASHNEFENPKGACTIQPQKASLHPFRERAIIYQHFAPLNYDEDTPGKTESGEGEDCKVSLYCEARGWPSDRYISHDLRGMQNDHAM